MENISRANGILNLDAEGGQGEKALLLAAADTPSAAEGEYRHLRPQAQDFPAFRLHVLQGLVPMTGEHGVEYKFRGHKIGDVPDPLPQGVRVGICVNKNGNVPLFGIVHGRAGDAGGLGDEQKPGFFQSGPVHILLPQGGCAPIPVQDGSGGRAALTEHNPQIRGAARGQAHLIHIDPVAEEILPAEFSVKVIADLARDGAVGAQSGRGHHAGGHLAAALPADAVEQAALIAFGNLVEIHGEVHAGSVQTEKIVFHRLPPGFTA